MKIPTVLRGDTPDAITLAMPQDDRLNGSKVEAEYQGVKRVFAGVCGGDVLALVYTRDEVRRMRLGTFPVSLTVVTASGAAWTVPADDAKIKITDSPSEVYNCQIQIGGGSSGIEPLGADPSVGDVKDKVNEIISRFGGVASALVLVVAAATAWGAMDVHTATLRDLRLSDEVVTNVTGAAGGGRAESIGTAIEWTDATGCVWRAEDRVVYTPWQWSGTDAILDVYWAPGWRIAIPSDATPVLSDDESATELSAVLTPVAPGYGLGVDWRAWRESRVALVTNLVGRVALTNNVPTSPGDIGAYPEASGNALENTVSAWQTYWDGDDVRVTVTNYYGSTGMPHLYLEEKMPADDTHDASWYKIVWDEKTRWTSFLDGYATVTNHINQDLADRAWGVYDSSTGDYSPDGVLQVSQRQIQIAAGLSYRKFVRTEGNAVWVLCGGDDYVFDSSATGGVFQVKDDEGNALLEIVKGADMVVGATASSIQVPPGSGIVYLHYPVSTMPDVYYCTDLIAADWAQLMTTESASSPYLREWHNLGGVYEVVIQCPLDLASCFFKAKYTVPGANYIKNRSPISVDGGILCTDGIHKVRPVYNSGSITWEVVP